MPVSRGDDRDYLREHQYAGSGNLNSRMALHERFSTNPVPLRRWLFDRLLTEGSPLRVLEVGCGPGTLWAENAERVPAGWTLTLTDLSPGMVEEARGALASAGVSAQFGPADADALPYPDASADLVIANGMLYHVPDRPAALAEIRRVLRPGGALHAWTVGDGHLRELDSLARRHVAGIETGATGAKRFGLENGRAQLEPFFAEIRRDDYPDALRITEVEPLLAYVRSWGTEDEAGLAALADQAAGLITRDGAFHVAKSSGVFICR